MAEDRTPTAGPGRAAAQTSAPPSGPPGYELLGEVGRGGMGVVHRARDLRLAREVAVKLLREDYPAGSAACARFLAEAQITGQLQHPGVPAVHELGALPDGRPFLAMKLVRGRTLRDLLNERPDPGHERGRLVAAFEQVCQAVGYAHAHRVLHRDLKPGNVMVGAFGEVQVMDWGLAKVLPAEGAPEPADGQWALGETLAAVTAIGSPLSADSATRTGSVMGTPAYMAPEQAGGEVRKLDARSDVFGLGAILCQILTGLPPYRGRDAKEVQLKAVRGELGEALARLEVCGAEPELVALCRRCLAFRQEERPADGQAVAQEVARIRQAAEERARRAELERAAAQARSAERRKRRRLVLGAAAVLALAAVGGLGSVLAVQRRANADLAAKNAELAGLNQSLRRAKYIADMNLARLAWDENNLVLCRDLLEQHRHRPDEADLRGFEWHYLRRLLQGDVRTIPAHRGWITYVAFLPDGKRLLTSGTVQPPQGMRFLRDVEGEVKFWDVATGQPQRFKLNGLPGRLQRVTLSRDGTRLAAACWDHVVRVWDLATGERITLEGPAKHTAAGFSFSPDGARLLSVHYPDDDAPSGVGHRSIRIWDLAARKPVVALDRPPEHLALGGLSFSPDGKYLVGVNMLQSVVKVWDAATGHEAYSCKYTGSYARHAILSPDGKRLVVSGDKGIQVWDTARHELLTTWPAASPIGYRLAFSPDGKRLAQGGTDGLVEVWDSSSGQKIHSFKGHAGSVDHLAFNPESTLLATGGADGTLRIWDTTGGENAITIPQTGSSSENAELSPDGQTLLTVSNRGTGKSIRLWDARAGEPRTGSIETGQKVVSHDWAGGGKRLFVGDAGKRVTVLDAASGKVVRTFGVDAEGPYVTALSPDEKWYAHSVGGNAIKVRDAQTGVEVRTIKGSGDPLHRLVFSPDGSRLLGVDDHGVLKIWDVANGHQTAATELPGFYVMRVRFSPDGKHVAVCGNRSQFLTGEVRILDAESTREVLSLKGHTLNVIDGAFSPDGQRLATASADRTIRLWDLATGQEILKLTGYEGAVLSLRFVAGGRRLISTSTDRTVRVWDGTPLPEAGPPAGNEVNQP
jgi:WD40 repeat protein/serine/threonine protein kinase